MADRFKFAEVRQKVIDIMKMDLLGPSSEEEVLSQNPRFEYLVGMLAPQTNEDDGSNEQEVDGDASFEGDDNYTAGERTTTSLFLPIDLRHRPPLALAFM